jgi:hypothetical protein
MPSPKQIFYCNFLTKVFISVVQSKLNVLWYTNVHFNLSVSNLAIRNRNGVLCKLATGKHNHLEVGGLGPRFRTGQWARYGGNLAHQFANISTNAKPPLALRVGRKS